MRTIFAIIFTIISALGAQAKNNVAVSSIPPTIYWDFGNSKGIPSWLTFGRAACTSSANCATDSLITDAAGSSYNAYATNVPIFYNGLGLGKWETRTQFLLNSAVPVTQTTASLATGTYQFWCIGSGSVTSSLGTATATGVGAQSCSTGTAQTISVSVSGTLTFTVSGSVDRFQLEKGAFPTPFIVSTGAQMVRANETAQFTGAALAALQKLQGSAITETIIPTIPTANSYIIIGTTSGAWGYYCNTSSKVVGTLNSVANLATTGNTFSAGLAFRAGSTWSVSQYSTVLSGSTVATNTNTTKPVITGNFYLGDSSGAQLLNGFVAKLAIWGGTPLSNSALQQRTFFGRYLGN